MSDDLHQMVEVLEANFSMLVTGLKELDATRRRAIDKPNASNVIFSACDTYCRLSKKTLRTTIQVVDRIIEDKTLLKIVTPGQSVDGFVHAPRRMDFSNVIDFVVRVRENLLMQRSLHSWKLFAMGRRMKKITEKRQSDMLLKLENAQILAQGAKSEFVAAERKDQHLQDEVVRTRAEIATLLDRVSKMTVKVEQKDKEISQVMLENENLKTSNKRLMSLSRASTRSRSPNNALRLVQSNVRTLNEQLEQSNEAASHLGAELDRLRAQQAKDRSAKKLHNPVLSVSVSECTRLDSSNDELEAQKSANKLLESRLKIADDDVQQLSIDLRQADEEIEAVSNARETLENQLEAQKTDARDKISELENRLAKKTEELGKATSTDSKVKDELARTTTDLSRTKDELARITADCSKTKDELARTTSDLSKTKNELARTTSDWSRTKDELSKTAADSSKTKQELAKTTVNWTATKEELAKTVNEWAWTKQELAKAKTDLLRANGTELATCKAELSSCQAELSTVKTELSAVKTELPAVKTELSAVKTELSAVKAELSAVKTDLAISVQAMSTKQAELTRTETELATCRAKLSASQTDLQTQLNAVVLPATLLSDYSQTDIVALSADRDELTRQVVSLQAQVDLLDSDLEAAEAEIEQLATVTAQNGELRLRIVALEDEIARVDWPAKLEAEKSALVHELAEADLAHKNLQAQISELNKKLLAKPELEQLAEMTANFETIRSDLHQAENELDELELRLSESQAEKNDLAREIVTMQKNQADLLAQLSAAKVENAPLEQELLKMQSDAAEHELSLAKLKEKLIEGLQERARMEAEIVRIQQHVQEQQIVKSAEPLLVESQLRAELANVMTEMSNLQTQLQAELDGARTQTLTVESQLRKELASLMEAKSMAALEVTRRQSELTKVLSDKEDIESRMQAELETVNAETLRVRSELSKVSAEALHVRAELAKVISEKAVVESELRAQLERVNAETLGVRSELGKVSAEALHVRAELAKVVSEKGNIECQLRVELEAVNAESLRVRNELNKVNAEALSLRTDLANVNADTLRVRTELTTANAEKSSIAAQLEAKSNSGQELMETVKQLVREKGSQEKVQQLEQVIQDMASQARPNLSFHAFSDLLVSVDAAGTIAKYTGRNKDSDMSGCLITTTPLPLFEEGLYFEVRVTQCSTGNPDGLTLGVTTSVPEAMLVPNTLDDIPLTWAAGYNGQTWNGSRNEWKPVSWSGKDLVSGQRVGILIAAPPVSQLFVFVNDVLACRGPSRLPSCFDYDYFGLVDLLGNCEAVTLLWGAQPPPAAADLVAVDPRKGLPRRTNLSDVFTDESNISSVSPLAKQFALPRLPLRPTAQPLGPAKPPSAASSDEE